MNLNFFGLNKNKQQCSSSSSRSAGGCVSAPCVTRLHEDLSATNRALKLMAVIVTIKSGGSYDPLFATQKQEAPEGGRVSTWQMELTCENMHGLETALGKDRSLMHANLRGLMADVDAVARNAVVFNFECSGGCSDSCGFVTGHLSKMVVGLIATMVSSGFFVMASDFALKALIASWDERLGPCPFVQVGTFNSHCTLRFSPGTLKECPSAQLVAVGRLCEEKALAEVHAMGGTIAVALANGVVADNKTFSMSVLTVQSHLDHSAVTVRTFPSNGAHLAKIGDHSGTVGHALLKFKNGGGMLMVASTHWVELSRLETDSEAVFRAFELHQGREFANARRAEYSAIPAARRSAQVQEYAAQLVQRAAPCGYSPLAINTTT